MNMIETIAFFALGGYVAYFITKILLERKHKNTDKDRYFYDDIY